MHKNNRILGLSITTIMNYPLVMYYAFQLTRGKHQDENMLTNDDWQTVLINVTAIASWSIYLWNQKRSENDSAFESRNVYALYTNVTDHDNNKLYNFMMQFHDAISMYASTYCDLACRRCCQPKSEFLLSHRRSPLCRANDRGHCGSRCFASLRKESS